MAHRSQGQGAGAFGFLKQNPALWVIADQFCFFRKQIGFMAALRTKKTNNYMSPAASPSSLGCLGLAIMGAVAVVGCRGGSGGDLCITAADYHLVVRSAGRTGS